ncbi:EAL domain-containing protein [Paenibacillus camelliae]|uniref:EAL domain-containing protein n=1 Tax=Paenibacillus camelliae TaxID=512410 RepID=UPI00203F0EAB|nr:EAL domain-containing protein [Paenibacillus camelliae]MCM3634249.1 EAL domain-containing protein [Paenibacillus camelliae]
MSDAIDMLLNGIIKEQKFYHACQPLFDLNSWNVVGYEALIRSELFENPEHLFKYALEKDRLYELDTCSIFNAILMHKDLLKHTKLLLNVYPSTLVHPSFHDFLNRINDISFPRKNLIFEVNEFGIVTALDSLKKVVTFLRTRYSIAIDDVGKGESTLRAIIELQPDYVKLDRYFSIDLSVSKAKQDMVRLLVGYCQENNIRLVLEGIEESKDLDMAKVLGVHLGQGFLLGKPSPIKPIFAEGSSQSMQMIRS